MSNVEKINITSLIENQDVQKVRYLTYKIFPLSLPAKHCLSRMVIVELPQMDDQLLCVISRQGRERDDALLHSSPQLLEFFLCAAQVHFIGHDSMRTLRETLFVLI